jgi:hypothetical protein
VPLFGRSRAYHLRNSGHGVSTFSTNFSPQTPAAPVISSSADVSTPSPLPSQATPLAAIIRVSPDNHPYGIHGGSWTRIGHRFASRRVDRRRLMALSAPIWLQWSLAVGK